jgi:hypothetical protein
MGLCDLERVRWTEKHREGSPEARATALRRAENMLDASAESCVCLPVHESLALSDTR